MIIELKIPTLGESITQVQISEWLKAEGDALKLDESVAVIDSEKTTFELPAPQAGRLTKILHQAGETVSVGAVVAQIEANGESAGAAPSAVQPAAADANSKAKPAAAPAPQTPAPVPAPIEKPTPDHIKEENVPAPASPAAAEPQAAEPQAAEPQAAEPQAAELRADKPEAVKPQAAEPPASREEEIVPLSLLRRTIARRLVEAQQTMAALTTVGEADLTAIQSLRRELQGSFQQRFGVKLGLLSFFVKAAIEGLKQFPQINAEIRGENIVYHNFFDVGVAIASERGLVVPVLRNAERLSFAEVEQAMGDFARRAKAGKLKPEDLAGGTFTITNGGVFGSLLSTPIINPPQTGILGLHAIQDRPVARAGQVVIRPMMYLALTYDHRLVDGREAVLFLRRLIELIETPARILLEV